MRRSRRSGHGVLEFGGSGEDSFVAVVVTKLTGALLFILLLAMVIMALVPKAVDGPRTAEAGPEPAGDGAEIEIVTPDDLPDAILGRPYQVALAARGGSGPLRWRVDGAMPPGLAFDAEAGLIRGTPQTGSPAPASLRLRVSDGSADATKSVRLTVFEPGVPLTTVGRLGPKLPPVPWRAWFEQGFGFLLLLLVHLVGMNAVAGLERRASAARGLETEVSSSGSKAPAARTGRRFLAYRSLIRLCSLGVATALAVWLWLPRS